MTSGYAEMGSNQTGHRTLNLIQERLSDHRQIVIVLDDDPTGTQSVAGLPVLTRWEVTDLEWALSRGAPAVYVLTNTRSLSRDETERCNREVVTNSLLAAAGFECTVRFVSRGDSTLRGHFPLETDVIAETLLEQGQPPVDGVLLVPAFPDAGRVTVEGVHYLAKPELCPIAETEFAKDKTFGYRSSTLADWVEEKSEGTYSAASVLLIDRATLRQGPHAVAGRISQATDGTIIACDAENEEDLRVLALSALMAEDSGAHLIFRSGPPFVRALIGQDIHEPLDDQHLLSPTNSGVHPGGLIVVGSHVGLTGSQLQHLRQRYPESRVVTLDAQSVADANDGGCAIDEYIATLSAQVRGALAESDVILQTSRMLISSEDPERSLAIARSISAALVTVVEQSVAAVRPRFIIAKGGITSSDVATKGLHIARATALGTLLPGLISLWRPEDGSAVGTPFIVFPGNVGGESSLADVVDRLHRANAQVAR